MKGARKKTQSRQNEIFWIVYKFGDETGDCFRCPRLLWNTWGLEEGRNLCSAYGKWKKKEKEEEEKRTEPRNFMLTECLYATKNNVQ